MPQFPVNAGRLVAVSERGEGLFPREPRELYLHVAMMKKQ
jgi:hypothetical protein